jgi:hypothetical protein
MGTTPRDLIERLCRNIRNQFLPDLDDKTWYKDHYHFIKRNVVMWPARFMAGKGFNLPADRYETILLSVLNEVKRFGETGLVKYWPGYLMKCVQDHWRHHWEEYYEEAKSVRNNALTALAHLGQLPTKEDHTTDAIAAAQAVLSRPKKRPGKPIATQPNLL